MKVFNSKSGFTLIELLVVIGILAVLAAIAIPSVAGLIDRANVSADKTNANEMTNAIERFAAEYELYCQDIASGVIKADTTDFDAAQGRVYNVTQVKTRSGIETLEVAQDATVADDQIAIYRDTKYPVNTKTMQAIVENYTKTSSATFDPKQSDMHFWYSPACGVVVVATPESSVAEKNDMILSGKDAKGNDLDDNTTLWIDLTYEVALSGGAGGSPVAQAGAVYTDGTTKTWDELIATGQAAETHVPVEAFRRESNLKSIVLADTVTAIGHEAFRHCDNLESITIPAGVTVIGDAAFQGCTSLTSITFKGTKAQWKAITLKTYCFDCVSVSVIHCTDGDINVAAIFNQTVMLSWEELKLSENGSKYGYNASFITDTSIGREVFDSCTTLSSLHIPDSVTEIGRDAFLDCTKLANITLPSGVTTLRGSIFEGCSALRYVTIPSTLTAIPSGVLDECSSLIVVNFEGTLAQWNALTTSRPIEKGVRVICTDGETET